MANYLCLCLILKSHRVTISQLQLGGIFYYNHQHLEIVFCSRVEGGNAREETGYVWLWSHWKPPLMEGFLSVNATSTSFRSCCSPKCLPNAFPSLPRKQHERGISKIPSPHLEALFSGWKGIRTNTMLHSEVYDIGNRQIHKIKRWEVKIVS